jgi:hypothetical protein
MLYPTETGWADAQRFYDEALAASASRTDAAMALPAVRRTWENAGKLKGATEHRPVPTSTTTA